MHVQIVDGKTTDKNAEKKYLLRWETLGINQDRPRDPPLPNPSQLKLIALERNGNN